MLYGTLLASRHIQNTAACDRTLYVASQNIIYEDSMCKEASTFLLTIENNMKVCFKSSEGNPFSISLTDYRAVVTYNYIYKTSSYTLKTKAYSRCKGTDHCSRGGPNGMGCRKFEKHEIFKEDNNKTVSGYGCDMINKYKGICFMGSSGTLCLKGNNTKCTN